VIALVFALISNTSSSKGKIVYFLSILESSFIYEKYSSKLLMSSKALSPVNSIPSG
jgi:hypothetical protein